MIEIPEVTDVEVSWGTTKALPDYGSIPEDFHQGSDNIYVQAVNGMFFWSKSLADCGLTVRADLDAEMVHRAIRAHLCSWEPQHQHKASGVAMMLAEWTEPLP